MFLILVNLCLIVLDLDHTCSVSGPVLLRLFVLLFRVKHEPATEHHYRYRYNLTTILNATVFIKRCEIKEKKNGVCKLETTLLLLSVTTEL